MQRLVRMVTLKTMPAIRLAVRYVVLLVRLACSRRSGWTIKDEVGAETGWGLGPSHTSPTRFERHGNYRRRVR
ncbi:hypothetical protein P171DRAFT_268261 [Karstenula rhodostoma CBS 690.94]|uniref:Uncharacterized protein n=1 Tax=Karstenula rhodostoma CBS 690.94 TaxID=1392251 RepID=A0A9P4UBH0_9PLEO|nr:hypothetical protein P171DRAFT_268261 [Karstenula rhodostoma CBS 690.94]